MSKLESKSAVDDLVDHEGFTIPLKAVQGGSFELVKALVDRFGASLGSNIKNQYGFTSAHIAAFHEVPSDLLEYILGQGNAGLVNATENGGWTPLMIAASKGNLRIVKLLLSRGANVDARSSTDQSALYVASHNGFENVVQLLLDNGADTKIRLKQSLESAAFGALTGGRISIMKLLLTRDPTLLAMPTISGATLLHAAAQIGKLETVTILLELGAEVDAKKKDGSTAFACAATLGHVEIVEKLVQFGASLEARNSFGATPLHVSCSAKQLEMVKLLLRLGADPNVIDSDQISPLQALCASSTSLKDNSNCKVEIQIFDALIKNKASIQHRDRSGATFLHQIVCKTAHADLLRHIVQTYPEVDLFAEDRYEYVALHLAYLYENKEVIEFLSTVMNEKDSEKFSHFDAKKPRKELAAGICDLYEAIEVDKREKVLNFDLSLSSFAKLISSGKAKNIIVMSGAGISTNSGIPDFRSPERGLYTSAAFKARFSSAAGGSSWAQIFSPNGVAKQPELFYTVVKEIFAPAIDGRYRPSFAHFFLSLLHSKGLLLRNYSQNIDMLELLAGVPKEKIVDSHGTFGSARCSSCRKECTNMREFWDDVLGDIVPRCEACRGVLRPNVVFFGEALPAEFTDLQMQDFKECDLLIVMGTSLKVYPFAGLANQVNNLTPRLLLNNEAVGAFAHGARWEISSPDEDTDTDSEDENEASKKGNKESEQKSLGPSLDASITIERRKHKDEYTNSYRDAAMLGDIDLSVLELVRLLGWKEEFDQMVNNYVPKSHF